MDFNNSCKFVDVLELHKLLTIVLFQLFLLYYCICSILAPLQVTQPRLFPRHPNLPAGLRPPFMPPPMGAGFQIPVAPQSEPNASMANPSSSGAPTSSVTSQIPGSAPDGTVSSMAPPHVMLPQMGGPGGQLPPHMFGPEG